MVGCGAMTEPNSVLSVLPLTERQCTIRVECFGHGVPDVFVSVYGERAAYTPGLRS